MSVSDSNHDQPTDERQDLAREELLVKRRELDIRLRETQRAIALIAAPWWRRADPLVLALIGAILTIFGNMLVSHFNSASSVEQEERKAANDLALERQKAKYTLILQAMATNDPKAAERNIKFFVEAGLLEDKDDKIRQAVAKFTPVLPSPSGNSPPTPQTVAIPEIARLYNFPTGLDGRGQTIGIIELDGGIELQELETYFASVHLPLPNITAVGVAGAKNQPGNPSLDTQIISDLEITGGIAPGSEIRMYFAPNSFDGWVKAIQRATTDHVTVLLIGWGQPESRWTRLELDKINEVLEAAAESSITIVCEAGDRGPTDGIYDRRRHVEFPASSPWVLAVGGTSLRAAEHAIQSEVVWNEKTMGATGGGTSVYFNRPDWQANVPMPGEPDGHAGRGIPDVVATASTTFARIVIHGKVVPIGGTTVSAAVWAGLISLLNQGAGHNIGYLNPKLYREIGPAGLLRPITEGDNTADHVEGFKAQSGWSPVAGWGSPNGEKLLEWFQSH